MSEYNTLLAVATNILFTIALGLYLITNLQWYSYKIERVVLKHHKPLWHLFYFLIPFFLYYMAGNYFVVFFYFFYLPALLLWYKKLDKKLVFTGRVQRFFSLVLFINIFSNYLCFLKATCATYGVFLPLALAWLGSLAIERYLFLLYKKEAKRKLRKNQSLEVIAVTGSFGKTSIKNFIYELLSTQYNCQKTPRSVNTEAGLIRDINENLNDDTTLYIAEAGARERGDIYTIATFLEPECAVVNKVGYAHIEYFKSLENIIRTKLEIISSPRLKKAFVHKSLTNEPHENVEFFEDLQNVEATLNGLSFTILLDDKELVCNVPNILGTFQATNIAVAIKVAHYYGMSFDAIKKALKNLKPVEHRLQKIEAMGKIILDDGYNGNLEGMKEAFRLCSLHKGDKVVVTPGLVESSEELNLELIASINELFDLVIVTGKLNSELFKNHLNIPKTIFCSDKKDLQNILAEHTKSGDIILFANDAPNFI